MDCRADLLHAQPMLVPAEPQRSLFQLDDAMDQAGRRALRINPVLDQQHCAPVARERLIEREDLAPVPHRIAGEKAQLGDRIEHHPCRLDLLDESEKLPRGLGQFNRGGLKHALLEIETGELLQRRHVVDVDRIERPVVRRRGGAEFLFGLGQGDQQAALVARAASKQKLQCQRGLASAWSALDEMQSTTGQSAPENVVQPFDAGRGAIAAIAGRTDRSRLDRSFTAISASLVRSCRPPDQRRWLECANLAISVCSEGRLCQSHLPASQHGACGRGTPIGDPRSRVGMRTRRAG
jgi:hypothetical protein